MHETRGFFILMLFLFETVVLSCSSSGLEYGSWLFWAQAVLVSLGVPLALAFWVNFTKWVRRGELGHFAWADDHGVDVGEIVKIKVGSPHEWGVVRAINDEDDKVLIQAFPAWLL